MLLATFLSFGFDTDFMAEWAPYILGGTGFVAGDTQVRVHLSDGYQALKAQLPPRERRGLVFIDSSFDRAGEFARLFGAVADHHAADARVAMHDARLAEVVEDVVEHRADEARVRV